MRLCTDIQPIEQFCQREFIRYRHIEHAIDPPSKHLEHEMATYYGMMEAPAVEYYVDSFSSPELLAKYRKHERVLQIEGEVSDAYYNEFIRWCKEREPNVVSTTHESVRYRVSTGMGAANWWQSREYSVKTGVFRESERLPVRRLTPADKHRVEAFASAHATLPDVSKEHGSGAVVRDFHFLEKGYPVNYYAVFEGDVIAGVAATHTFTPECDEVSAFCVPHDMRGKGVEETLLSRLAKETFAKGRQPALSLAPNDETLIRILSALGFYFVATTWYTEDV